MVKLSSFCTGTFNEVNNNLESKPHFPDLIPTTCPRGDLWYIWWIVAPGALWDTNFPCIICSCSHPLPVICWLKVLPAVHISNLGFDVNIALVNAPKLKMQQLLLVGFGSEPKSSAVTSTTLGQNCFHNLIFSADDLWLWLSRNFSAIMKVLRRQKKSRLFTAGLGNSSLIVEIKVRKQRCPWAWS